MASTPNLNLRLEPELRRSLEIEAEKNHLSVNGLIKAVAIFLTMNPNQTPDEFVNEFRRRVREALDGKAKVR